MTAMYDRLTELLTNKLGVDAAELNPAATFEELDIDSLALVELTDIIEGHLGIVVGEGEIRKGATLAEAAQALEIHAAAGQ
ncbi:acyl carrier protein [Streptomyces sp. NPDC005794]|uniref:acyl carrier protein n=1 Tax=Streptomyces sp. NPDC005794 TaxID=3364733 RepID=UPI0036C6959F